MADKGKKFSWWTEAEQAFGEYFGPLKEDDLSDALEAWCKLDAKEHRFYESKLMYLVLRSNLTLARLNQQVLEEMRQINADADVEEQGDEDEQPAARPARAPAPRPAPAGGAPRPPRPPARPSVPDQPTAEAGPRGRVPPSEPSPDAPDNNGMGGELVDDET